MTVLDDDAATTDLPAAQPLDAPPPVTRVVVVHGLGASSDNHWFGAVRDRYTPHGVEVLVPDLPRSQAPDLDTWLDVLADAIGPLDEGTVLVGHSLGCVTILQHLAARQDEWRLGGLALVAGFVEEVPGIPEVDHFVERPLAPDAVAARSRRRHVVVADADPVVPRRLTETLARVLDADLTVVEGGGHFVAGGGFDRLPALEDVLDAWTGERPVTTVS
ncbi:RBBP9/YdeN family alpha/beta hydrolase [Oerskovia rustica]|uniref:Alpha/beta fold hydrolase n=1 Tax=Oerskovia rustica TaxID=2762237 RepID=A0ABR8RW71_9CELL|nr:alpha/beta fold hydrolase [Oerskovia rustica]MBD7952052.1 alpha/beta fold hydrolase [Oerskovia rustica]